MLFNFRKCLQRCLPQHFHNNRRFLFSLTLNHLRCRNFRLLLNDRWLLEWLGVQFWLSTDSRRYLLWWDFYFCCLNDGLNFNMHNWFGFFRCHNGFGFFNMHNWFGFIRCHNVFRFFNMHNWIFFLNMSYWFLSMNWFWLFCRYLMVWLKYRIKLYLSSNLTLLIKYEQFVINSRPEKRHKEGTCTHLITILRVFIHHTDLYRACHIGCRFNWKCEGFIPTRSFTRTLMSFCFLLRLSLNLNDGVRIHVKHVSVINKNSINYCYRKCTRGKNRMWFRHIRQLHLH